MDEKEVKEIKEDSKVAAQEQKAEKETEQIPSAVSQTQNKKSTSGLAIAGFVLGVVGICISFIPAIGMAAIIVAVIGLVLAVIGIKGTGENSAKAGRGLAIAGLVLCLVAGMISISQHLFCSAVIDAANDAPESASEAIDDLSDAAEKLDSLSDDLDSKNDTSESTENTENSAKKQDAAQKLSDGEFSVVKKAKGKKDVIGTLYISGTLKNDSGEDKSYVQVSFNVFDKEGNLIGTGLDNINHLKAGATWKYKAMCLDADGYKKFEMAEITSW